MSAVAMLVGEGCASASRFVEVDTARYSEVRMIGLYAGIDDRDVNVGRGISAVDPRGVIQVCITAINSG
jgi:hypothetical protein